jgi:hypothetical protein
MSAKLVAHAAALEARSECPRRLGHHRDAVRALAISYGTLLLGIVVAADLGALRPLVRGLHAVPLGDKLCHFVLATGLGIAAAALPDARKGALRRLPIPLATLVVALVAALEELSQRFIPGRTFDLADMAADGFGIALGTLLALRFVRVASRVPVGH